MLDPVCETSCSVSFVISCYGRRQDTALFLVLAATDAVVAVNSAVVVNATVTVNANMISVVTAKAVTLVTCSRQARG